MIIKQVRRYQYVVYDANGMVVVITRCKGIALAYVQQLRKEKTPAIVVDA
jgi:hypothetical protein